MSARRLVLLAALAAAWAGSNALKPPHIDDGAYACYARQFATRPLDPYGFSVFWWDVPEPANEVLAPPVLPATWAAALRLVGDRPWLCKLLLAPWAFLFVLALDALLRRFAPGMETPLVVLTVFSPAFLPSLNLMLDVPTLALGLASLALFLRACDRDSYVLAALAGLVAGVAMETKYTAFLLGPMLLAAAVLRRRWRLWLPAAVAAAQVFVAWELIVALLYGESHFLYASRLNRGSRLLDKLALALPLGGQIGGLTPALTLLGLAALGAPSRALVVAVSAIVTGFVLLGTLGNGAELLLPDNQAVPADFIFGTFAVAAVGMLAGVTGGALDTDPDGLARRDTLFLLAWLGLEVLGALVLSPFAAARRVFGIIIVMTLLAGRLASRTCDSRRSAWVAAGLSATLGVGFATADLLEARAQSAAVMQAADFIQAHGDGRIYYMGHWGFQYAAERAGMMPLIPEYNYRNSTLPLPPPSRLQAGDWIVVPLGQRVHCQGIDLDEAPLEPMVTLVFFDRVPYRTVYGLYAGRGPLEHHSGPRLEVAIYRVKSAFTPQVRP